MSKLHLVANLFAEDMIADRFRFLPWMSPNKMHKDYENVKRVYQTSMGEAVLKFCTVYEKYLKIQLNGNEPYLRHEQSFSAHLSSEAIRLVQDLMKLEADNVNFFIFCSFAISVCFALAEIRRFELMFVVAVVTGNTLNFYHNWSNLEMWDVYTKMANFYVLNSLCISDRKIAQKFKKLFPHANIKVKKKNINVMAPSESRIKFWQQESEKLTMAAGNQTAPQGIMNSNLCYPIPICPVSNPYNTTLRLNQVSNSYSTSFNNSFSLQFLHSHCPHSMHYMKPFDPTPQINPLFSNPEYSNLAFISQNPSVDVSNIHSTMPSTSSSKINYPLESENSEELPSTSLPLKSSVIILNPSSTSAFSPVSQSNVLPSANPAKASCSALPTKNQPLLQLLAENSSGSLHKSTDSDSGTTKNVFDCTLTPKN